MPDYEYQRAQTYYVPLPDSYSDGSESVPHVPQWENGHELAGVWVWFEWGEWVWVQEWDLRVWISEGYTSYYWLPRPGSCFAPGTRLLTPDGFKPIEQFKAGDWILSSPEDDPQAPAVARRVQEVTRTHGQVVDIAVNGQVVRATREHPFYVKGKGWTLAASVAVGDLLRSHDDRWVRVESIANAGKSPVYNVRVEEHNTYFVGSHDWDFSLWVYGACNRPKTSLKQVARSKPVRSLFPSGELHSPR
jgi:hypothetical protein